MRRCRFGRAKGGYVALLKGQLAANIAFLRAVRHGNVSAAIKAMKDATVFDAGYGGA